MFIIHLFIHVYYSLIDTCLLLIACVALIKAGTIFFVCNIIDRKTQSESYCRNTSQYRTDFDTLVFA